MFKLRPVKTVPGPQPLPSGIYIVVSTEAKLNNGHVLGLVSETLARFNDGRKVSIKRGKVNRRNIYVLIGDKL